MGDAEQLWDTQPAWHPGSISCTHIGKSGELIEVDMRWRNVSKLIFITIELTY